jgi:hypothetical protein
MRVCAECEHWQSNVCQLTGEVMPNSRVCVVNDVEAFDPVVALRRLRKRTGRELRRTRREAFAPFRSRAERAAFVPLALSVTEDNNDWRRGYLRACLTFGVVTPERHDEIIDQMNIRIETEHRKGTA